MRDFQVPVIAVLTKYDRSRCNITMKSGDRERSTP
jgi:hypothetical protein